MYYSCADDTEYRYGVGFIIRKEIKTNVTQISERIIILQIKAQKKSINIFQIYAPTAIKSNDEIEDFYHHVEEVLQSIDKRDGTLILDDLNAKVGEDIV